MNDTEKDLIDSLSDLDEQTVHFSQLGSIHEASLKELRDQIKKVMIPLLIKTFQYQLDLIPSSRSRVTSEGSLDSSLKEAYEQLKTLDYDLKNLQLWCQSCRSQIHRALDLPDEEPKSIVATADGRGHPGIAKSFAEAMTNQSCTELASSCQEQGGSLPQSGSLGASWWKTLFRKK